MLTNGKIAYCLIVPRFLKKLTSIGKKLAITL